MGRLGEEGPTGPSGGEPPSPTAARRPLAGCQPSSPAVGRRAPQTLRALPPRARLLSRPRPGGAGALRGGRPPSARALQPVSRRPAPPPRPRSRAGPPHSSFLGECRRRRRRLPRLESACWRSAKEEGGGRAGRLGLRRVRPRETRIVQPREGRPGWGRCTPRAEAEPGPRLAPAARRAHPAPRRGLQDEFPRVRVSWLVRRVRVRVGRGRPRQGGWRGLGAKFRGEPGARGRPELGAAGPGRSAGSPLPRLCQAAADWALPPRAWPCRRPGPPGRPPRRPRLWAPLCSPPPGFRPSLGRRCGLKLPPRTILESLNGKDAHLPARELRG